VPDEELPAILAGARAVLFPGAEDFGIVPVEAQAAGVPVIAYGTGGVRDSVREGRTGVFFAQQTADALAQAIRRFEGMSFDEGEIRDNARAFAPEHFRAGLERLIAECRTADARS
jgi:glycosyltransferase involved in cell wall biosynthesis